jgi:hypothetical protein
MDPVGAASSRDLKDFSKLGKLTEAQQSED